MSRPYPEISFEHRMSTVEFRIDEDRAHITVDDTKCRDCSVRGCITACPADLFVPTADGGILFNYEQCFECGTCYLVCNEEGATCPQTTTCKPSPVCAVTKSERIGRGVGNTRTYSASTTTLFTPSTTKSWPGWAPGLPI